MQAIINGEMYEVEPAVKVIIDKLMIENAELKKENARLEELYQKSVGVIAATDCAECKRHYEGEIEAREWEKKEKNKLIDELKTENEALKLLIEWAEECDFGYDNFPEEYERYKGEIEGMGYIEGMIHIAKRVCQQKRGAENEID